MTPEWYHQNVTILRLSTFLKPRLIAVVLFNFSVACDISCSNDDAVMTQCFDLSPVLMTVTRMPDDRFFSYEFLLPFVMVPRTCSASVKLWWSVDPCLSGTISSENICSTWSVHIKRICARSFWSTNRCRRTTLLTVSTYKSRTFLGCPHLPQPFYFL